MESSEKRRVFSESQVPLLKSLPLSIFSTNSSNTLLLSERQIRELNASIIQYLKPLLSSSDSDLDVLETLKKKLDFKNLEIQIPDNYLQKKWSTVLRLQRNNQELLSKLDQLEDKNNELTKSLDNLSLTNSTLNLNTQSRKINWLPSYIKSTLRYHTSPITAVAIHPFKPFLITASQDGMMVFWNLLDLVEPLKIIANAHSKSINDLIFKKNSPYLISCSSDQIIKVWDLSNSLSDVLTPIMTLTGHEHIISSLSVSSVDSNILFSTSRDNLIKIWDLTTGWCTKTLTVHSDWVRAIDSIGEYIITCSSDTSIRLTHYITGTGIGLCLGHTQVIEDVIFLPQVSNKYIEAGINDINNEIEKEYESLKYKYAASCGRDKIIKIWKLPLPSYNLNGNPTPNTLNPYGECIKEIKGHQSWVRKLQIHYNGRYLFSCSDDQSIKIWDLNNLLSLNNNNNNIIEPVKNLMGHKSFINTITLASPIPFDNSTNEDGEQETPKQNYGSLTDLTDDQIRCYLISGGADNQVNIWA